VEEKKLNDLSGERKKLRENKVTGTPSEVFMSMSV
jgi:hypothetical protein